MEKTRVLFICTENTARSQMAEGLLRHHAGDRYEAYSAGCVKGKEVHPLAVRVMAEAGIDISGHYPKELKSFWGSKHFGYQITVCKREEERELNCPIYPGMGLELSWPFEDPRDYEGTGVQALQRFRDVRDQVDARIRAWLEEREAGTAFTQND